MQMGLSDHFFSVSKRGKGQFKDRGSKFIGIALPVIDERQVEENLTEIRTEYHDARHHCFAWVLGPAAGSSKANDNGEPSHSAGDPILGQIKSRELTNTLVVVVRYFGGTKLGVGGLINAYKTAASEALDAAGKRKNTLTHRFKVSYSYENTTHIAKLAHDFGIKPVSESFREICRVEFDVPISRESIFFNRLGELKDRECLLSYKKVVSKS